jgi:NTE family protein
MVPHDFAQIPFLRDADAAVIKDVSRDAIWVGLPGGQILFDEGEPADMLWFVRTGSLGAFRKQPDRSYELLGHIRTGEPIGEMAMIAGEVHSSAVFALRDSELFGLNRTAFNRLIRRHPQLMASLARTMLFRSRQARRSVERGAPKVVALLAASPTLDMSQRGEALRDALGRLGKRAILVGSDMQDRGSAWFDDIERWNDIVLMVADIGDDSWTRMCLRQADRIWIFGRADARPSSPLLPESHQTARNLRLVDVVLARTAGTRPLSKAAEWMAAAGAARLFPWRSDHADDVAALARTLASQSIGLVLGGGGARAYAHIGVIRALREAGIRFDFLGGTSMGAVVAACVAMGWDDGEIERRIWDGFVKSNPLDDYVLPVVALSRGRKVDERLAKNFGDIQIEDLDRPFFAVSADMTTARSHIHRTGRLSDALRASIALPGILPPVVKGNSVLVDGAVLDNLPVGIMRDLHRGPNIGVDVAQQHALNADEFRNPPDFAAWVFKHGFKSPPPIADLLMRAATAPNDAIANRHPLDLMIVPQLGNVQLRDWKAFDVAVEAGYLAAVEALRGDAGALSQLGTMRAA